ncbi:MAG: hypothetical protein KKE64_06070 [Candidatus Omnitrophica bacterium]|nr:hypothetical protein [Candidatus Omnitrophota bacterium]
MFAYLESDFSRASYRIIYCLRDFERCVRKPIRDRGETVPDKMLPDGSMID